VTISLPGRECSGSCRRAGRLAGFPAGDLLSVRLRDGALEISERKLPEETAGTRRLRDICAFAAVEALKRYVEEAIDHPFVLLHEILIGRMFAEPGQGHQGESGCYRPVAVAGSRP
jgi:hypothetical protein